MADRLLEIKDLKVSFFTSYGEIRAVNGVSLTLDRGEVLGVVGESGSGKSVMAGTILGLVEEPGRVTGGSVVFDGADVAAMSKNEIRRLRGTKIGMVFQNPSASLDPVRKVGNQLREAIRIRCGLRGRATSEKAAGLLKLVGIGDPERCARQYPLELSGGMCQRVMIAMAIAGNPELLIADEPTTALDATIQSQILGIMNDLKARTDLAILFISHDLGVVAEIADRVAVMYGGKIVESAPAGKLFREPRHPYTLGLLGSLPRPDGGKRLTPIDGTPADALDSSAGCPFAPRCRHCMKVCLSYMPPYTHLGEEHDAACWLFDERAERGKTKQARTAKTGC